MYNEGEIVQSVDFGIEEYNKAIKLKQREAYEYIGEEVKAAGAGWLTVAKSDEIAKVINKAVEELYLKRDLLKSNAIELSKKYDWTNIAIMSINEYQKIIN